MYIHHEKIQSDDRLVSSNSVMIVSHPIVLRVATSNRVRLVKQHKNGLVK